MRQLSKYSFANAKIRAMLSYLLSGPNFNLLLEAGDLEEAVELLKKTNYKDILEDIKLEDISISTLEKGFFNYDLWIYDKVGNILSSETEKSFVFLLKQRYEIEQLKVILRLWHNKLPVDWQSHIIKEDICYKLEYKKLIASQSIEEFILLLDQTPYKAPLIRARDKYKDKNSAFYIEASLDVDYYQRILDCVANFTSVDKKIASKVLGIEVDIENINWLIRLRKYYSLGIGEMLEWFIPGGNWIKKETVRNYYTTDGLTKVVESVALGPYAKIKDLIDDNASLIENFLYEFLLREVRRMLCGFPFTIGTVMGYLVLKHRETKNIISILNAKRLGWKKEEIVNLLSL